MAAVSPELVDLLKALFADKHGELAQALQREAWAEDWALKLDPNERTSPDVWLHQLALRARLEGCDAELLALLRRLRSKRVAEIDAVAGVLRPAEPPAAPAPPMGGATLHPGGTADHRAALAQSAPPEDAPAPPSGPTLVLHLTRAARGDRRVVALPTAPIEYHRHLPDGRVRVFTLDWPALIPHVTGLATARSADAVLGLGRALREALLPSGWDDLEDALAETLRHGPALLLIQVNADELHSLPWEAMPLGLGGSPLAEACGLTILHHQPGVRPPPSPRGAPKAILLAWAGARGRVPATSLPTLARSADLDAAQAVDWSTNPPRPAHWRGAVVLDALAAKGAHQEGSQRRHGGVASAPDGARQGPHRGTQRRPSAGAAGEPPCVLVRPRAELSSYVSRPPWL